MLSSALRLKFQNVLESVVYALTSPRIPPPTPHPRYDAGLFPSPNVNTCKPLKGFYCCGKNYSSPETKKRNLLWVLMDKMFFFLSVVHFYLRLYKSL